MADADALSEPIETERLRRFFAQNVRSLPTTLYPALAIWLFFWWVTRSPGCFVWAALIHGWQALRIHAGTRPEYQQAALADLQAAERRAVGHVVTFALLWGLAPWMLMPEQDHAQLSVMLLMLVGVMAGSANGLAFSLRAGLSFQATLGGLLMAWLLWQRTLTDTVLAVSTAVFTGTLMLMFRNQQRHLVQLIRARLEQAAQARTLAEQKAELERLHQERSRLFATASHDLRQPVQALNLQAQTLAQALDGQPQAAAARRIGDVTQSLSQTLDAILDLHQLDHVPAPVPGDRVDAEALLFEAAQLWRDIAERRGLSLRFHSLPGALHAPRITVQRMLYNLIDNALKYTRHGGVLVAVRQRQRACGPVLRLEVWDTGPGIAAEHQPQVFQAFFRAPAPAGQPPAPGLGLGLSAVQRVCRQLGWPLGFRSRPGRGSVFWLEVPAAQPPDGA